MADTSTVPSGDGLKEQSLIIAPAYTDPITGAVYVHRDLVPSIEPWEREEHVGPLVTDQAFGDVASWCAYVQTHSAPDATDRLLTWSAAGLAGVLDYHRDGLAGRCQHVARQPFLKSPEFLAWETFANGAARRQKDAIEQLETLGEDISEPAEADLMAILRNLRAAVNSTAETELRPDGTTTVAFGQTQTLKGKSADLDLPSTIAIVIPVLRGDVDKFRLLVRLRASVDSDAHLALRFSLQNAERALETVYLDRVKAARGILGEAYPILRAA